MIVNYLLQKENMFRYRLSKETGVVISSAAIGDESIKKEALANAIPEFMRFNIVESEVRNVC